MSSFKAIRAPSLIHTGPLTLQSGHPTHPPLDIECHLRCQPEFKGEERDPYFHSKVTDTPTRSPIPYAPNCININISLCMRVDVSRPLVHFAYVGDASIAVIPIMPPVHLGAFLHMITFTPLSPQSN